MNQIKKQKRTKEIKRKLNIKKNTKGRGLVGQKKTLNSYEMRKEIDKLIK